MPLDAICLGAVTEELNTALAGCRIEKVYQPDRDEIVLQTRGQGGARRLLLSIAAGAPRAHFIDAARENPAAPPMFCMLLRKHCLLYTSQRGLRLDPSGPAQGARQEGRLRSGRRV